MPRPKFGNPGDEDALFIEDVIEEVDVAEGGTNGEIIRWGINVIRETIFLSALRPNGVIAMRPEQMPLAIQNMDVGHGVMLDAYRDVMEAITDHDHVRHSQGIIHLEHRRIMQFIVTAPDLVETALQENGLGVLEPELGQRLRDAAAHMMLNLDLYVEFDGVQTAYADIQRRHEQIMAFIDQNVSADLFDFWPELHSAFIVYKLVAPDRMVAVAPRLDSDIEQANVEDTMELDAGSEEGEIREREGAEGEVATRFEDARTVNDMMMAIVGNIVEDEEAFAIWTRARAQALMRDPQEPQPPEWETAQAVMPLPAEGYSIARQQQDIVDQDRAAMESVAGMLHDALNDPEGEGDVTIAVAAKVEATAPKLAVNINLYFHPDWVRNDYAAYNQRHNEIMEFIANDLPRDFLLIEPAIYSAFMVYKLVAPDKMAAAAPQGEDQI